MNFGQQTQEFRGLTSRPIPRCPFARFLQLDGYSLSSYAVEIDSTPPTVVDLYSTKGTSPWGVYTVGEEVCPRSLLLVEVSGQIPRIHTPAPSNCPRFDGWE